MTFKAGESGNPGGRPKEDPEVKKLARAHTTAAIKRLAHWLKSDNASASIRAAEVLLDRAYGKAVHPIAHAGADGQGAVVLRVLHIPTNDTDEIARLEAEEAAERATQH